jgi:hypothetical protein
VMSYKALILPQSKFRLKLKMRDTKTEENTSVFVVCAALLTIELTTAARLGST